MRDGGEVVLAESKATTWAGMRGARYATGAGAIVLVAEGAEVTASGRAFTGAQTTVWQHGIAGAPEREL